MLSTPAQEAINLLMELAQQGAIDPWNVQVIDIIDRFLGELGLDAENPDISSLSQSGQAFVWASHLVWLKADTLQQTRESEIPADEEITEDFLDIEQSASSSFVKLERHLKRRTSVAPLRNRKVSLQEFIEQLQNISREIEKSEPTNRPSIRNPRPHSRREALRLVTELAHQENLLENASFLEGFLLENRSNLNLENEWISLDNLLKYYPKQNDRCGVFWALLLLSAQSKVELYQLEFYGDLQVRLI